MIVSSNSLSQEQILKNLTEYRLKRLGAQDTLDSSTIEVITQLMAGTATWLLYFMNQQRRETYLQTATKEASIYNIARMFGYNVSRACCPRISLIYNGVETITLKTGDIIATLGELDLVYFGNSLILEKGDTFTACLGKFKTFKGYVDKDTVAELQPSTLSYIDNNCVRLLINLKIVGVSKDVEDFVIHRSPVDFSISDKATEIYIKDSTFGYGVDAIHGTEFEIHYLETLGRVSFNVDELVFNGSFIVDKIASYGTESVSLDKIKKQAPLYYSTMRRAVTALDITYIGRAHSLIEDCFCLKESGVAGEWDITLKATPNENDTLTIALNATTIYSVVVKAGESVTDVLGRLATNITYGQFAVAEVRGQILHLTNLEPRVVFSVVVSEHFNSPEVKVEQITPACCTASLYYIREGQTREGEILILSNQERIEYAKYLQKYKMAGLTLVLIPATRVKKTLNLKVKVDDNVNLDEVRTKIKELVSTYEFRLGVTLDFAELLTCIAQIDFEVNGEVKHLIKSVINLDSTANVALQPYEYLVFDVRITQ